VRTRGKGKETEKVPQVYINVHVSQPSPCIILYERGKVYRVLFLKKKKVVDLSIKILYV